MSSETEKVFEGFARDCVRLANQADSPELREKLLNLAREWMHAVIETEDAASATARTTTSNIDGEPKTRNRLALSRGKSFCAGQAQIAPAVPPIQAPLGGQ